MTMLAELVASSHFVDVPMRDSWQRLPLSLEESRRVDKYHWPLTTELVEQFLAEKRPTFVLPMREFLWLLKSCSPQYPSSVLYAKDDLEMRDGVFVRLVVRSISGYQDAVTFELPEGSNWQNLIVETLGDAPEREAYWRGRLKQIQCAVREYPYIRFRAPLYRVRRDGCMELFYAARIRFEKRYLHRSHRAIENTEK